MSRTCAPGRRPVAFAGGTLAVMIAVAVAVAGCANGDTQTSVYLEIYDDTMVSSATDVSLDVFDSTGGQAIGTLHQSLPSQTSTSPTAPLGSVVIFAGANTDPGTLGITLRITGQRTGGGKTLSEGTVDVTLQAKRQVSARLTLVGRGGTPDGGGADSGGGVDAGPPPADAGTDAGGTLLANGDSCRSGSACTSGFCTSGICCDSACTDACHTCNLSGSRGTCTPVAAGTQCAPASCTSNDSLIPARTCDGNGTCGAAGSPVSCGNYRCQNDACLRSCSSSTACTNNTRCFNNRCQ